MTWTDPLVAGEQLVRTGIRSPNYTPGQSGWRIAKDGSAEFANVAISVSGASSGLQIIRSSDGMLVGSISEAGIVSAQGLSVAQDDVEIAGVQLSTRLARQAASILAYGSVVTGSYTSGFYPAGVFEVAFTAPRTAVYQLSFGAWLAGQAGETGAVLIYDGDATEPNVFSPMTAWHGHGFARTGVGEAFSTTIPYLFTAGIHRLLLLVSPYGGSPSPVTCVTSNAQPAYIQIMDTPEGLANVAVLNAGLGGGGAGPGVQTYQQTIPASWSGTYSSAGAALPAYGDAARQGSTDGTAAGNLRSMIGWDPATLTVLAGSTILDCSVVLSAESWMQPTGGTAVIGTHAQATQPATWSGTPNRVQSPSWPRPGVREVNLGVAVGVELRDGVSRGLVLGPGPTADAVYCGSFTGASSTNPPLLRITYQK